MSQSLLKKEVEQVEDVSGNGTALISLYIPAGKNIQRTQQQMGEEKSQAANIKSDQNRKNVETAIEKVNRILKRYKQTPENGMVVFAGVTHDGETVEFIFDDFETPLDYSDYTCDSKFDTEKLRERIAPDHTIGLAVIERGGVVIGELRGTNIIVHKTEDSQVMGKHRAGGQSALRFDRLIEEQKDSFFKSITSSLESRFVDEDNQPTIDAFVVGGTQITVDDFLSNGNLPSPLESIQVGGIFSVDMANEQSLEQLVSRAREQIDHVTSQEERESTERFFKALHKDDMAATYGENQIQKALEYGAVEKLLVSDKKSHTEIEEYEEMVESQGGELVIVSTNFEKGQQLWDAFNGLAALLRYDIE